MDFVVLFKWLSSLGSQHFTSWLFPSLLISAIVTILIREVRKYLVSIYQSKTQIETKKVKYDSQHDSKIRCQEIKYQAKIEIEKIKTKAKTKMNRENNQQRKPQLKTLDKEENEAGSRKKKVS